MRQMRLPQKNTMYQELIHNLKIVIYEYVKDNLNQENQIRICEQLVKPDCELTISDIVSMLSVIESIYNDTPDNIIPFKP